MKKIMKKGILQKTIIVILMVLTFNFIVPTYSSADFGGALMSPIVDLFCSLGDAVINLLQVCMTGNWASSDMDFSFNAFMVEDDEFFVTDRQKYVDKGYISTYIPTEATSETINVDKKGPNGENLGFEKGWLGWSNKYHVPVATYSPEQIFAGKVAGLDINFIDPNEYDNQYESSASQLQPTIAKWYVALRNLTIVGLLSVLVYVGIRIIISSTASDKAKYKQMLVDWLIALCLVFFLHYIMSFVLTMTQSVCEAISANSTDIYVKVESTENSSGIFKTNLLGLARFKTQYADFGQKMAYLIMYLALVIYTCIFTFFYLKRLLMMAFLTIIAPVVALTYPIDKMGDGKSQAFDKWLKEYVFNALIQPFHLIIYTVFVGSAMDLASTNIIYMVATLWFIMTAEKILRGFFGFDKASGGTLGGLASAAVLGSMAKKVISGRGGSGGKGSSEKEKNEGEKPPRMKHDVSEIDMKEEGNKGNEQTSGGASAEDANATNDGEDPTTRMRREALEEQLADGQLSKSELSEEQRRLLGINNNNNTNANQNSNQNSNNKDKKITGKKVTPLANWANRHNINGASIAGGAWKGIKGAAKFATKTAFKAGAGTLAGAVALASGSGLAGAGAAFMAGSSVGGRLGDATVKAAGFVGSGVGRVGRAISADWNAEDGEHAGAFADALLGGTALGREIDLAYGNTRFQDAGDAREIKNNKENKKEVIEHLTKVNGGVAPTAEQVKAQMDSFDPYIAEGLTEIKEMLNAQKAEKYVGTRQAAMIAAIGKERGITEEVLNDEKRANAKQANLMQEFMDKGYSKTDAAKQADYTMNVLKVQNNVAHNMKKPSTSSGQNNK